MINSSQVQAQKQNIEPTTAESSNDEISFREIMNSLRRHKRLVALITGSSVIISGLYALFKKPVWQGNFQIVVENKDGNDILGVAGTMENLCNTCDQN